MKMEKATTKLQSSGKRGGLFKIDQGVFVWILAAILVIYLAFTVPKSKTQYTSTFALSFALAIVLYMFNDYMIPQFKDLLLKAGLCGKDLNKPGSIEEKQPM